MIDESLCTVHEDPYAFLSRRQGGLPPPLRGFTLVELMVSVAIAAILLSVALPSYQTYVMRGKIPDATSSLSIKAMHLEQYFQDNKTYVGSNDCASDTHSSRHFTFQCTASTASSYTLVATGIGSMAGFSYSVDSSGNKQTSAVPAGWLANSGCWVNNTGGAC